jgi:hypothetical protein
MKLFPSFKDLQTLVKKSELADSYVINKVMKIEMTDFLD